MVQKSEENLIQVTEDGEHRKRKLKKIIVLLAVFGSVMAGILIYLLTFKNQPRVNYIEPLAQDSTEMNIAGIGAAQATITGKLADSAKIARNASTIAMISDKTPEEIEADGAECGNKKLRVTVNRNGMQMTQDEYIDLLFDGNHILYEQAKQHIPQTPF